MAVAQSNIELIPEKDIQSTARLYENIEKINSALIAQAKLIQGMPKFPSSPNDTPATEQTRRLTVEKELNRLAREKERLTIRANTQVQQSVAANSRLRRELQLQTREHAANAKSVDALRVRVQRLKDTWSQAEIGTKQYRRSLRELAAEQRKLSREEQRAGIFGRNVGNYAGGLAGGLKTLAARFVPVVAVLGLLSRGLRSAANNIINFEQANAELATILGKSRKDITALTESSKFLGLTTEWTAAQVTSLQTELAKLGFNEREIQASQATILQFATAMDADLPAAAALAGASLRAFGLDAVETERVTGVMAVGANKSALSFSYLETAMSIVSPVARSFGFSIEDTVALLGTLSNAGFDASSAATATRNILLNLADANGKLAVELGKPVRTIPELVEGLKALRDRGISLSETLELTDRRSVAAFNAFLNGTDTLINLRNELNNVDGELKRMQEERLNTIGGSLKLLNSAWEGLTLSFMNSAGPIKSVIDWLTSLLIAVTRLIDPIGALNSKIQQVGQKQAYEAIGKVNKDLSSKNFAGMSAEDAQKVTAEAYDKQISKIQRDKSELQKTLSFFSKEQLDDASAMRSRSNWAQALVLWGKERTDAAKAALNAINQVKELNIVLESLNASRDAALKPAPSIGTGAGIKTGTKPTDNGHRQRMSSLNAERKAVEDLTTAEIEQEQWRLKNTISAKDTSIAERTIAMERYYNLEEQRIKELARVQKENLIQKNIDENTMVDKSGKVVSTISPEQAAKNVATQLLVIDTALQHKLEQNTYDRTQAQQEYENEAIEFAIRGAQRRMQAEMNAVDQQESDDLLALAQDRNRNLLMSDAEYEDKKTAIQRAAADKRNQIGLDELNNQLDMLMSDPNKTEAEDEAILDLQQKIADEEVRINKEKNERIAEDDDTADERRREAINAIGGYIKDMYNSLLQARKNATEAELEDLDKQGEAAEEAADEEQERIDRLEENGAISKEEADARRAQSEETLAAKQAEIDAQRAQVKRRQAEFDKKVAIGEAFANTANAVLKAYAMFGPPPSPWGIAAAVAAGLAGAAQIAVISAQKIPEYATGTDFHKGGLAVVGDGGRHEAILSGGRLYKSPAVPSLVDMPTGAQVLPDYNIALRDMILNGQINAANAQSLTPMKVEAHINSAKMEAELVDVRKGLKSVEFAIYKGFGIQQSRARRAALMNKRIYKINDKK